MVDKNNVPKINTYLFNRCIAEMVAGCNYFMEYAVALVHFVVLLLLHINHQPHWALGR
jgi:hypothetical protein